MFFAGYRSIFQKNAKKCEMAMTAQSPVANFVSIQNKTDAMATIFEAAIIFFDKSGEYQ